MTIVDYNKAAEVLKAYSYEFERNRARANRIRYDQRIQSINNRCAFAKAEFFRLSKQINNNPSISVAGRIAQKMIKAHNVWWNSAVSFCNETMNHNFKYL